MKSTYLFHRLWLSERLRTNSIEYPVERKIAKKVSEASFTLPYDYFQEFPFFCHRAILACGYWFLIYTDLNGNKWSKTWCQRTSWDIIPCSITSIRIRINQVKYRKDGTNAPVGAHGGSDRFWLSLLFAMGWLFKRFTDSLALARSSVPISSLWLCKENIDLGSFA